MSYLSVIVPLALPWEPDYRMPEGGCRIGDRVRVRISGREYVAVVSGLNVPSALPPEKILPCPSPEKGLVPVSEAEIRFWRALADYYLCTVGEVYKTAYPSFKTASEETAARVHERMQQRLERLRAELDKKHRKESVRERIAAQIAQLEQAVDPCAAPRTAAAQVPLTPEEEKVHKDLLALWKDRTTVLLASADPTGVFLRLSADCLSRGRSVLWLVPEIALTAELEERIARCFPALLTYHSHLSAARRRDVADILRRGTPSLVLATRSALMLPFAGLGLILVDQEHDPSYKQDSPAPRYNTRDAAVLLARIHGAKVLLGSASPSLESLYNAISGRFGEVSQPPKERAAHRIELVDIPAERRKKGVFGLLSRRLADEIRTARKTLLICPTRSSYCTKEAVETELEQLYGEVPASIRTGTQPDLLAKGENFSSYDCVALLQGDALLLGQQDFRGDERAWQMLTRLLLRCRRDACLLIQTSRREHPLWDRFLAADAEGFRQAQLAERRAAQYPPYTRLVDILIRDNKPKRLDYLAGELARETAAGLPGIVQEGPFQPQRPDSETLRLLRLSFPRDKELAARKQTLAAIVRRFETQKRYTGHIVIDVDPA